VQAVATAAKQRFYDAEGDYAGLLRLYKEWAQAGGVRNGLHWAKANYVHSRAMCRAADVREQLLGIMHKFDMPVLAANRSPCCPFPRGGLGMRPRALVRVGCESLCESVAPYALRLSAWESRMVLRVAGCGLEGGGMG
jgi:hypothetical protein